MRTKNVMVVPYDPKWKNEFERLKSYLKNAIGGMSIEIEHVGSTSVEGLWAKPIIDIDIVIEKQDDFERVKDRLEKLGYYHEGDLGIKGREAFGYDEKDEFIKHHLYVCHKDSQQLKNHIKFRNYLRQNKEDRDRYSEVKAKASKGNPKDIEGYMEEKSHIIEAIYKKIGL
ncbi:GrpB family protein [Gudongella sp. DL1XJH-153]|uniref:GrpB family protein n=1 Tax=Gudongella sp. DL1XJH-153 TaxID=3409804 RepID=UPI003BB64E9D